MVDLSRAASRRIFLFGHELDDLTDRVQVLDARLVRLDRDPEMLFQENDELQRPDRIEDTSGDQGRARS